jgi:hypothetical protein
MSGFSLQFVGRKDWRPFSGRSWIFGSRYINSTFLSFRVCRSGRKKPAYEQYGISLWCYGREIGRDG